MRGRMEKLWWTFFIFGLQFSEVVGQLRKCSINFRMYNLHIMMEAIKLSHYCRDCMYDRTQESKLKFFFIFQRAFTTSYPFATLWCISKKNKLLSCFNIQFSGGTRTFWKMCWLKARLEFDVKLGCDSRNWKFKFHFWSYMQDEVEVTNRKLTFEGIAP